MAERMSDYWLSHENAYPYPSHKAPEQAGTIRRLSQRAVQLVKKALGIEVVNAA